jgi:hypothetical protein
MYRRCGSSTFSMSPTYETSSGTWPSDLLGKAQSVWAHIGAGLHVKETFQPWKVGSYDALRQGCGALSTRAIDDATASSMATLCELLSQLPHSSSTWVHAIVERYVFITDIFLLGSLRSLTQELSFRHPPKSCTQSVGMSTDPALTHSSSVVSKPILW